MKKGIEVLRNHLKSVKNISIICHINPDGDAIGSALALCFYFTKLNYNVNIVIPNNSHEFISWLPGIENVLTYTKDEHKPKIDKILLDSDLIFCVDFNVPDRISKLENIFSKTTAYKVLIDHHENPESFTDLIFSDKSSSSTAEIVYDFLVMFDGSKKAITKEIAECLYVGILTDTGSFSYSIRQNTHLVTSLLLETGIDPIQIHHNVYYRFSESRLRLLGYCLNEKLVVLPEYNAAYFTLSKEEQKNFNFKKGDTEGIVNYALTVAEISLSAIIIERDEEIKLSFRSKGDINVSEFASDYFNGGGHINASGGYLKSTLDGAVSVFLDSLTKFKKKVK